MDIFQWGKGGTNENPMERSGSDGIVRNSQNAFSGRRCSAIFHIDEARQLSSHVALHVVEAFVCDWFCFETVKEQVGVSFPWEVIFTIALFFKASGAASPNTSASSQWCLHRRWLCGSGSTHPLFRHKDFFFFSKCVQGEK